MAAKKQGKSAPARSRQAPAPAPVNRSPSRLCLIIIGAGLVVYLNSFKGTYVLDDIPHIGQNPKIESLEPVSKFLFHDRRPLVTFSLAVNYALGQRDTWGYHLVNLVIHLAAALTLFGVVRRTLRREPFRATYARAAPGLALTVALIWVVHPLQTQSVTYLIQRAESLMGLFYLLTIYCFIRGTDSPRAPLWYAAMVAACATGMASKGVMVTAPLMVLAYDLVFVSPSPSRAFRRRWALYAGLACTWYVLLMTGVAPGVLRSDITAAPTVGFSYKGATPLEYALTQPGVVLHYLRLSLWPHPLCLDYCWPIAGSAGAILPPLMAIGLLLAGVAWALYRRSWLGFAGLWFFIILSPTSSFIPIRDTAFEHRMYLPLAAVAVVVVVVAHTVLSKWLRRLAAPNPIRRWAMGAVVVVAVASLGWTTILRNEAYESREAMYKDVIDTRPNNARAYNNLGTELRSLGRTDEALEAYRGALTVDPGFASAYHNIAAILEEFGRQEEALEHFRLALEIEPQRAWRHFNLANCLAKLDRLDEAVEEYHVALRLEPDNYDAHFRLATVLMMRGSPAEAIKEYRRATQADPRKPRAHYHLGLALRRRGRLEEAASAFRGALEADPGHLDARNDLGATLVQLGQVEEGVQEYRHVLRLDPNHVPAHYNLGIALQRLGRLAEAVAEYQAAARLQPDHADAYCNLGIVLGELKKADQAIGAFRQALLHDPRHVSARYNLGVALLELDRPDEAIEQFQAVLAQEPDHTPARQALEAAKARR